MLLWPLRVHTYHIIKSIRTGSRNHIAGHRNALPVLWRETCLLVRLDLRTHPDVSEQHISEVQADLGVKGTLESQRAPLGLVSRRRREL